MSPAAAPAPVTIAVRALGVTYPARPRGAETRALQRVSLSVAPGTIHALIGPAGSGKSSLLRALNLMAVEFDGARLDGQIVVDGVDVLGAGVDVPGLRRKLGMVAAQPHLLPGSIRKNLCFGPRLAGVSGRAELEARVEESLRAAQLWDEVKDRLDASPWALSAGQQQRLCIARALALRPAILLLDEPCSGLDPISTLRIEETLRTLKGRVTFVLATSNTQQAARVGDRVAFLLLGELIEDGAVEQLFTAPADARTNAFLSGRIG